MEVEKSTKTNSSNTPLNSIQHSTSSQKQGGNKIKQNKMKKPFPNQRLQMLGASSPQQQQGNSSCSRNTELQIVPHPPLTEHRLLDSLPPIYMFTHTYI